MGQAAQAALQLDRDPSMGSCSSTEHTIRPAKRKRGGPSSSCEQESECSAAECSAESAALVSWHPTGQPSKRPRPQRAEQDYVCGYCGKVKTSASACSDGRVRIRCECGGQRRDGKPRMHATWSAVGSPAGKAPATAKVSSAELQGHSGRSSRQKSAGPVSHVTPASAIAAVPQRKWVFID